jgi:mono/diheme cytochrome c family protein
VGTALLMLGCSESVTLSLSQPKIACLDGIDPADILSDCQNIVREQTMNSSTNKFETLLLLIIGLLLVVIFYVYMRSDIELYEVYNVPIQPIELSVEPGMVAEGERLSRVRGCFWCHGQLLEGQQYFAEADKGLIAVAPNLTRKVREYTPSEFARAVRHGIKKDGTSVQPAMPSFAFYNMSDADIGAIITYIRSLPLQEGFEGEFRLLPVGWFRWVDGQFPPNAADLIDHVAARPDPSLDGSPVDRGRYLAESICTECHGDNGRIRVPNSPDLIVAAAYSREDFYRLIRTGVPLGGRKIDYHMVDVSKYRYTELRNDEVDALYAYFRSLAGLPAELPLLNNPGS